MAEKQQDEVLQAREFTPIDQAAGGRRRRLRIGGAVTALLALGATAILVYLFSARAVIFHLTPEHADLQVSGLDFNLGRNYLVLPGERTVTVTAEGYHTVTREVEIAGDGTREITIDLKPLPGNLRVTSELEGIEVAVDGEPAGTVPGVVEGIERGTHSIEFSRHRYFPLKKEIAIEGLGRTQEIDVALEPAWGWLELTSEPAGARVFVDGRPVAETPARVEVVETGSKVRLVAEGYKNWERELTVAAGTTEQFPPVELEVADGTLAITSTPAGATVTIDGDYIGETPVDAPVSPFGEHRVELFLEGYLKADRRVEVESERTTSLEVDLEPDIGEIRLDVSPASAEVVVDGRVLGTGSRTLALPAKPHRLEVRRAGYASQRQTVVPKPGRQQSLTISLLTEKQAYWAQRPPVISSPVGTTLKLFRPGGGAFTLGAPRREPGRRANEVERKVALERPFYVGEREITNRQFRRWRETHSSTALRGHTLDMDKQPVVMVSWQDAALFCNWLSEQEGQPRFYRVADGRVTGFNWESTGYRLPTEAEWAWVAKIDGDRTLMFPWGSDGYPPVQVVENYADPSAASLVTFTLRDYPDGYPVSAAVGSFPANHKGLFDIGGNVAEWVNDRYDVRAHSGEPLVDPRGPEEGNRHVVRGASWAQGSRSDLRLSARRAGADGELDIGFRIARYVDNPGAAR